jgi:hypothetical protein
LVSGILGVTPPVLAIYRRIPALPQELDAGIDLFLGEACLIREIGLAQFFAAGGLQEQLVDLKCVDEKGVAGHAVRGGFPEFTRRAAREGDLTRKKYGPLG